MDNDEGTSLGDGEVLRGTNMALLVRLEKSGDETWIPRSVIHDDSEVYDESKEHGTGKVVVKSWWAEKNGLG